MKKLIFILSIFVFKYVYSQNLPSLEILSPSNQLTNQVSSKGDNNGDPIKGSVYLKENWTNKLSVKSNTGKIYEFDNTNFNVKENLFVVNKGSQSFFKVDDSKAKEIYLNGIQFVKVNGTYYEVIAVVNNSMIVKFHELTVLEGQVNPFSKEKVGDDKYKINSTYHIVQNNTVDKFKLKSKKVLSLMNEDKVKQVKKYAKDNSLSFKKENELRKIIKFYTSI
ncbi:hypothetical protein [uncultured Tenacibaculum sp.]|uniref:hypothetical protein n=1 Tax=uncultured Tenacibaculum sp. TaxID=174713 RepID=UPI002611926A|nr:hypothetical protein [uncultured Tenacibaculum sp.]